MKNCLLSGMLIILSTIFSLIIVETCLRIFEIGYGNAPLINDPIFHHVHPKSYSFLSHDPCNEFGGHHVFYDNEGLVFSGKNDNDIGEKTIKIAFLGDSFTEAVQVGFYDSFVGIIKKNVKGVIVKNYAVSSYCPIFYCLLWEQKVKYFKPDIVIMQLYSNDISSDESYKKNAIFDQNDNILAIPGSKKNIIIDFLRNFYTARLIRKVQIQISWQLKNKNYDNIQNVSGYIEENPDITDWTKTLILKCKNSIQKSGALFYLFAIPSKYRLMKENLSKEIWPNPQFSDKIKELAIQNDINFIDMTSSFRKYALVGKQLFFDKDIHLTKVGHEVIARQLLKEIDNSQK